MTTDLMLEEPVAMCHTQENVYWCHGWTDKTKFRGHLLSQASDLRLDGVEDTDEIIRGKVKHGYVISVMGDTSGCGWDMTMHFETIEPTIVEIDGVRRWIGQTVLEYDDADNESEVDVEVADGPHKATWWEL